MDGCLNCGTPLAHFEGRRKKVFCSAKCRVSFNRKKGKPETITIKRTEYDKLVASYSSTKKSEATQREPEYVASVDPYVTDTQGISTIVDIKSNLEKSIADVSPNGIGKKKTKIDETPKEKKKETVSDFWKKRMADKLGVK